MRSTTTVVTAMAVGILAACQTEPATVERTSEVTATVAAIDLPGRLVTLRGPEGNLFTVQADEEVRNLPQVEVGDRVVVSYYEAIAAEMAKPGQKASASVTAMRAPDGAKPGGVLAQEVTATVKITDLDLATHTGLIHRPRRLRADDHRAGSQDAGRRRDAQSRRRGRGHLHRGARDQRRAGQPGSGPAA